MANARKTGPPPSADEGLVVVGRKEYVDFPEWGVRRVRAKIDTGAYSSALDVASYDLYEGEGGVVMARLTLALSRARPDKVVEVRVPVLRPVVVASTCGTRQVRPLLEAAIRLGPVTRRVRLTIADRAHMRYRLLLGRQALAGAFLVDVRRQYLWRP